MKNEKLITDIYNHVIRIILSKVRVEYQNIVATGYLNYLKNMYLDFDIEPENYEKSIEILKNIQYNRWMNSNEEYILKELTYDEALIRIETLSGRATAFAITRLKTGEVISNDVYNEYVKQFDELIQKVYFFNQNDALRNIGDGKLDLLFACGRSEDTSLRINHNDYQKSSAISK